MSRATFAILRDGARYTVTVNADVSGGVVSHFTVQLVENEAGEMCALALTDEERKTAEALLLEAGAA